MYSYLNLFGKTSTIVQLRSRSFGFERCAVAAILPNRTKTLDPAITVHSKSLLDLWQLDTDEEISPYVMDSWKFSARRRRLLGQFYFLDNDTWTSAEFPCPPGTFFTFEVACSKTVSGCHVDFWQDRESPNGMKNDKVLGSYLIFLMFFFFFFFL